MFHYDVSLRVPPSALSSCTGLGGSTCGADREQSKVDYELGVNPTASAVVVNLSSTGSDSNSTPTHQHVRIIPGIPRYVGQ
jgi:hypothetical protein